MAHLYPVARSRQFVATSTLSLLLALLAVPVFVGGVWATARRHCGVEAAAFELGLAVLIGVGQLAVVGPRRNLDAMSVVYLDRRGRAGPARRRPGRPALGPPRLGPDRLDRRGAGARGGCRLIGFYATHVEPYAVSVDRAAVPLPAPRAGDDVLRIGVLTDLQTTAIGDYERHAVRLLQEERPDIVFVCGDLFQGTPNQFAANRSALRDLFTVSLDAPGGVYVVQGDTDDGPTLDALFEGTPVTYLWNQVVETQVGDRTIRIAGLGLGEGREGRAALAELAAAPPSTVRLALTHQPDWITEVHAPGAVDLMVAGHTHGGQIQLPWFGPLMTLTDVPRDVAAGGLHDVGRTPVYVSHGVGHEQQGAPQVRFLAPPSVGLVTLSTVGGEISP